MDGSYKENTSPKKVTIKKSQSKEDIQIIINKIIKLREHGKRKKPPHTPLQENTFLKSFTKESGRGSILEKLRNGHSLSPAQQKSLDKMFNDYE
jgi:ribosome assembly protein YihI (activator of Der GTPase)